MASILDEKRPRAGIGTGLLGSNELGLAVVIVLFAAIFGFATDGFTSTFNIYALSRVLAIEAVIGFSMMVVIVTGGLNLAVGAIGASAAMMGGLLMQSLGLPVIPSLVCAILFGGLLGWLNGIVIVRMGVHSFIVTLATMSIFFGAMILLTGANAFNELPASFVQLGKIRLFGTLSGLLVVTVVTGAILGFLFHYTSLGREILAAGANPRAALLSGVPVGRTTIVCHTLSGALAGVAGLMVAARNGAALPGMAGQLGADWLLPAFLAPVLGGTLLAGGAVSVTGTLLGAILVSLIRNGLLQLKVAEFWIQAFLGVILLAAVTLDRGRAVLAERRRARGR